MSGSNVSKDSTLRSSLTLSLERSCVSQQKGHTCIAVCSPGTLRLVPAVEEELKRLENLGVLKPVEVSDWATPIVFVPKTDESVRICGDYRDTVNPAIQTEQFPIPTL